jgi:Xaa-Pro aminopeptidase
MVTTIEPGYYEPGKYGIRIENMVFVKPYKTTGSGQFLQFETLTLCPLDTAPIVMSRLTSEERDWLNRYHRRVWSVLSPRLDLTDRAWLKRKTAPI